jgi:cysteine-rich repeat protein
VPKARQVGTLAGQITLPDDSVIDQVDVTITQGMTVIRTGSIPVMHSTILTFRLGGIPLGTGYNIALNALTGFNQTCLGDADFDILNNQTTAVSILMICGATDDVGDLIVDATFQSCPLITQIQAIPGETTLTHDILLSTQISHGMNPVLWTGPGGTFGSPNAYTTTYTCDLPGSHTLTVAVNTIDCHDAQTVDVICTLGAGCGNGVLDPGEQCDDGNTVNDDTCSNACRNAACGDGILQAGEQCDDNNTVNGDACTSTCQNARCGDGIVQAGVEQCDDGNTVDDDACSNSCQDARCGDGIVQAGETCDDGNNTSSDACTNLCAAARCGDGIVQAGVEGCDDGNTVDNDACSNACTSAACGDGILQAGEGCDDGNTAAGDGCSAVCQVEVVDTCTPCRDANCRNYLGVPGYDVVAGCFDAGATGSSVRTNFGAIFDALFIQNCVDAVNCSFANNCAYDTTNIVNPCYCGAISVDTCNVSGPTATAPCRAQWEAATRGPTNTDVLLRISDTTYPSGWAYNVLECDATLCNNSPLGDCTP